MSKETLRPYEESLRLDTSEQTSLLSHKEPAQIPQEIHALLRARPVYPETENRSLISAEYQSIARGKAETKSELKVPGMKPRDEAETNEMRKRRIKESQTKIQTVHMEAEHSCVEDYEAKFTETANGETVMLAEVGVDELKRESEEMERLRTEAEIRERELNARMRQETLRVQEESRAELHHKGEVMKKQIERNELASIELTKAKHAVLNSAFKSAGKTLSGYLQNSRSDVVNKYSGITVSYKSQRHNLAGDVGHTAGESWTSSRQIVEVRVELARCVKDKLPKGRYAVLCSVMDRLGGNVMDYQKNASSKWHKITAPKTHNGEHYLNNLRFEKSLLIVTPSRAEVKPSMIYLFELFLLKSKEYVHDQVLGWGVFPLINADFELNQGKFKVRSHTKPEGRFRCCSDL